MKEENPFTFINSKPVYKNPWMEIQEDSVIRPGGKEGVFGVIDIMNGVTVVALDRERNIHLTREYKYAQGAWMVECVSGGVEEGEDPLVSAKRELLEEIGGESERWRNLGYVYGPTMVMKHRNEVFLAEDVEINTVANPGEGEVIELVTMPFAEAYRLVQSGEIVHSASVVGILKTHILLNER